MSLPIRVPAHPGESWPSYHDRVADAVGCPPSLLQHRGPGVAYPDNVDAIANYFHLNTQQVRAMHVQTWSHLAFARARMGAGRPPPWTWLSRPRACAHCIQETGYRKLIWFSALICVCPTHGCYLNDEDPPTGSASTEATRRAERLENLHDGPTHGVVMGEDAPPDVALSVWRDATLLASRLQPGRQPSTTTARAADSLLSRTQELVDSPSPQTAAAVLTGWWTARFSTSRPDRNILGRAGTVQLQAVIDLASRHWS